MGNESPKFAQTFISGRKAGDGPKFAANFFQRRAHPNFEKNLSKLWPWPTHAARRRPAPRAHGGLLGACPVPHPVRTLSCSFSSVRLSRRSFNPPTPLPPRIYLQSFSFRTADGEALPIFPLSLFSFLHLEESFMNNNPHLPQFKKSTSSLASFFNKPPPPSVQEVQGRSLDLVAICARQCDRSAGSERAAGRSCSDGASGVV